MCGIVGWLDYEQDLSGQKTIIQKMAQTLAPRGPDQEGAFISRHALLAHRRLIVVDPQGGLQPMSRSRGGNDYHLIYNGELYNTPQLRRELTALGHSFLGHSDTEVLLAAYMQWGADCMRRLDGIFAFAIWQEPAGILFLGRDRLGVKPLFFTRRGSSLFFASEIKALLAHPQIPAEVDREGLAELFALGPGRTPGCGVFRGIEELEPGHWLTMSHSGMRKERYWQLRSLPHQDDLPSTVEKVRYLLTDAVQRQLVSDMPLCTLLSGGLDSSVLSFIAAEALREKGQVLNTYSIDYKENQRFFQANSYQPQMDAAFVPLMVSQLGTKHHSVLIGNRELVAALEQAVRARDLPGMADIDASLYLFSCQIKKESTVALSGECADELFGGYPWFYRGASDTFPWYQKTEIRQKLLSAELKDKLNVKEYIAFRYRQALSQVPRLEGEAAPEARMRELFYLNLTRWMPVLLDRKDRMSMATGLEIRVPFCDHHLAEYVWNIPWEYKYHRRQPKGVLREAFAQMLPSQIVWRKNSPYPKTHHPVYCQLVQRKMLSILKDKTSPLLPLVDVNFVAELAAGDLSSFNQPWFGQLMSGPQLLAYLVQTEQWLREYKVSIL